MLCVAAEYREQVRRDLVRVAAGGEKPRESEPNLEEPERWDGMS
jgi:hypothetical protein